MEREGLQNRGGGEGVGKHSFTPETSDFGTCIQKYVTERYVCLIVFMVIAQTHVQAVAMLFIKYCVDKGPLSTYSVDMCPFSRYCMGICPHSNYCADIFCWFLAVSWINTLTRMV